MKKILIVLVILITISIISYNIFRYPTIFRNLKDYSLSEEQTERIKEEVLNKDYKILVAYFSYSGTTREVATKISEQTNGDIFEIKPKEDYQNVYLESNLEIRFNKKPELSNKVDNIEQYDIIFIGYPVWYHATPSVINTFLESYDFTNKLVIPFCTSGGSNIEESMDTFLNSCNGIAVYQGKRISSINQVEDWVIELNIERKNNEKNN